MFRTLFLAFVAFAAASDLEHRELREEIAGLTALAAAGLATVKGAGTAAIGGKLLAGTAAAAGVTVPWGIGVRYNRRWKKEQKQLAIAQWNEAFPEDPIAPYN